MSALRAPSAAWLRPGEMLGRPWRLGRHLGRTVYVQVGPEPSNDDVLLGLMETETLARHVVDLHNQALDRS